ncbi:MAG TPA: hypothetical protein VM406_09060 [Noviherbaspirillum sp.]|nr:hypothetical protein [Noviherbaspirillum sp.]
MNTAERKQQLIDRGALYRARVMLERERTRASLRPLRLSADGVQKLAATAITAYAGASAASALARHLPAILPPVLRLLASVGARKGPRQAAWRFAAIGAVGAAMAAAVVWMRRLRRQTPDRVRRAE